MGYENLRQDLDTTVCAETAGVFSVQHEDISLKTAFQYFSEELIARFQEKQECGEELTKEDMALLTLFLLMDGKISLKDRVEAA